MSVNYTARLQTLFIICMIILGLPSEFLAQNRVIARVEPNKNKINNTAEIYDPASKVFSPAAGLMFAARVGHTETRLLNGKVLLTGGINDIDYLNTAEIYDPSTKTFSETTKVDPTTSETVESLMNSARTGHTATLLNNGMVLIVGGFNGTYVNTAELFNPTTGVFTQISNTLVEARAFHAATLLPDGQVLITGGYNGSYLKTIELFNPQLRQFIEIGATTNDTRAYHTGTLMSTGEVLIAGGFNGNYLNSAVVYTPSSQSSRTLAQSMTSARSDHAARLLQDGKVLLAGGTNGNPLATAETYDPSASTFTATAGQMTTARDGFTATVLASGKVLLAGGTNGTQVATADIYDPASRTFSANPSSMASARQNHTATLLADGKVLIAGGQNAKLLAFDVNTDTTDDLSPNIVFSSDSTRGFVSFTGSGTVLVFSAATGAVLKTIDTGGKPDYITPLADGHTLAVASVLDNRIFLIDMNSMQLISTLTFSGAQFGFGSIVTISHSGSLGFISSTGTGEVIKFSLPDGKELGRLTGLQAPAQITLTPDDATLIVVDVDSEQLIFADASTMKQKTTLNAKDKDAASDFSIFNNVVLSSDGSSGIIASRGLNANSQYTVFIFTVSTGAVLATEVMSNAPGFTALTPDNQHWVILAENSLFYVPVADPGSSLELSGQGQPLTSSNLVFSPDSKYAYYASSTSDLFVQQDLSSVAVVGELNVGDDPNLRVDQTSSVAVTPDGKTFAALNFVTNNIALIASETVLNSAKFDSGNGTFTSLSLVNVSATAANLKITAMSDFGGVLTDTDVVNPVNITLPPNGQISTTVDQLFNFTFTTTTEETGWLSIESDQPGLVGYVSIGRLRASFLGAFIDKCNGTPLFRASLYDWIVPEVSRETGDTTEFNFVNRNFNTATYDVSRIVKDGTLIEKRTDISINNSSRTSEAFATTFTQSELGNVLIAGGENSTETLSSAEFYNSDGLIFTATSGTMSQAIKSEMAVLLSNGKALLAGGRDSGNVIQNNAEIYDPVGSTFTLTTGAMNAARYRGTATLLPDGRVLIAGGLTSTATTNTAETYDPTTDTFSLVANAMSSPRSDHTATLLNNGKVLIVGGSDGNQVLNTAELYDPKTRTFTPTGSMATSRAFHTATLLSNGQVLIAGGFNGSYTAAAEIYDPSTGAFSATPNNMAHARAYHTSTLLADGRVLIVGGADATGVLATAELFDPSIPLFMPSIGALTTARKTHGAFLLTNGKVLVVGGTDGTNALSSAELYDPLVDGFSTSSNSMTAARNNFAAVLLSGGTEGYVRVQCTPGLTFSEFFGGANSLGALNGIEMSNYSGVTRLFSPQFATVSGFTSILNVINGNTNAAVVTISLHNADGSLITQPVSYTLVPGAQLKDDLNTIFNNNPLVAGTTGWLEVDSTVDEVVGTISFTDSDGVFLTTLELQGTPLTDSVFPLVAQNDSFLTGIAFLNPNTDTAAVALELWAPDGTLMRSNTINLPPNTRTAAFLNQFFPNVSGVMVANVRVHSNKPIFGFALLYDSGVHFLEAIPPIPFPPIK